MIYFSDKDNKTIWSGHIGTRFSPIPREVIENVYFAQADGDELEKCASILDRSVAQRVFTFVGEQAQTIAVNWK